MNDQWSSHLETLSLTEIIRLQNQLSGVVTRRFEKSLALCFSDIVGSTRYFERFGDEAGQRLQQQHFDLLSASLTGIDGRIIHTAGDGVLLAFSQTESAVDTIVKFRAALWNLSCRLSAEEQWTVRGAIHWGPVLTDGDVIAGDTVNLCSKITSAAKPGVILLSKPAVSALPAHLRKVSRSIGMVTLVNPANAMELFRLSWHDLKWPILILIEETGERIFLPDQPVISIGRLAEKSGSPTNDMFSMIWQTTLLLRDIAPMTPTFPQPGPPIWLPMAILILATNVRFIDFHFAHQLRKSAVLHRRSNAMAHIPGRAVDAAPDLAMSLQRADTLLALGHEIDDLEPGTDWVVGILKDGFCNDRKPIAVPSATVFRFADPVKRLGLQFVDLHVLTARALHVIRLTLLLEKLLARFFGRETFYQLRQRHAGFRHHVQPSLCWRGFFTNDLWVSR
ncbi:MAG: adenylate/guanylate cyclase domain-containing protein [Nitrospirota bacterium]